MRVAGMTLASLLVLSMIAALIALTLFLIKRIRSEPRVTA